MSGDYFVLSAIALNVLLGVIVVYLEHFEFSVFTLPFLCTHEIYWSIHAYRLPAENHKELPNILLLLLLVIDSLSLNSKCVT